MSPPLRRLKSPRQLLCFENNACCSFVCSLIWLRQKEQGKSIQVRFFGRLDSRGTVCAGKEENGEKWRRRIEKERLNSSLYIGADVLRNKKRKRNNNKS
jgi:hypothetical protein